MRPSFEPGRRLPSGRVLGGLVAVATATVALLAGGPGAGVAIADDAGVEAGAAVASSEVTLRKGDRGAAVRRLQRRLGVPADGVFGPMTRRAVKRFQRRHGLVGDGIVGPLTRRELGLASFSAADVAHPPRDATETDDSPVRLPRVLVAIAECESGGNPRAVSANGLYRGKFQFSRGTWKAVGGRGDDPARASEAHQDRMALRLYRAEGVAPWPACGARAS
ncbi:MAG TPA: transglycosylase family protein [Thermoleophilaceae bacterium]|nr:transglycosylase family protein [Thermoleophilaceae bacterium]